MRYLKYLSCAFAFLMLSFAFSSCSDDTQENAKIIFGLTSATSTSSKEITAIELAYTDAYQKAGLKFNIESFAPGTSKDIILKACLEAENAIESSSIKFGASYTYEIFEITTTKKECIYRKVYGVRQ